jgi:hypothetical protein
VGLIAEGPTDITVLESILKVVFDGIPLITTVISPTELELTQRVPKPEGFGWRDVYQTCRSLEDKLQVQAATGIGFDLLLIHIDGDVMFKTYGSANIQDAENSDELPCFDEKLTVSENCARLGNIVRSWLGHSVNRSFVIGIPYINMELWAAYCLYSGDRYQLREDWTEKRLNTFLLAKGKKEGRLVRYKGNGRDRRLRKDPKVYSDAMENMTAEIWGKMRSVFSQARLLHNELLQQWRTK